MAVSTRNIVPLLPAAVAADTTHAVAHQVVVTPQPPRHFSSYTQWLPPHAIIDPRPIPYTTYGVPHDERSWARFVPQYWGGPADGPPVLDTTRIIPHQVVPTPARPQFFAAYTSWKAPQEHNTTRIVRYQVFPIPEDQHRWARFVPQYWGGPAGSAAAAAATIQTRLMMGVGL